MRKENYLTLSLLIGLSLGCFSICDSIKASEIKIDSWSEKHPALEEAAEIVRKEFSSAEFSSVEFASMSEYLSTLKKMPLLCSFDSYENRSAFLNLGKYKITNIIEKNFKDLCKIDKLKLYYDAYTALSRAKRYNPEAFKLFTVEESFIASNNLTFLSLLFSKR